MLTPMIELSKTEDSDFLKMPRRTLTGEAKWRDIEDLINRWAKRKPRDAIAMENYIKETRGGLYDKKFAKSNAEGMGRMGVALHPELMTYIGAFYPDFLSTKPEMHEFMRRFPKFTIPEKV